MTHTSTEAEGLLAGRMEPKGALEDVSVRFLPRSSSAAGIQVSSWGRVYVYFQMSLRLVSCGWQGILLSAPTFHGLRTTPGVSPSPSWLHL